MPEGTSGQRGQEPTHRIAGRHGRPARTQQPTRHVCTPARLAETSGAAAHGSGAARRSSPARAHTACEGSIGYAASGMHNLPHKEANVNGRGETAEHRLLRV
eukprot:363422-Chlamydomonas_euryale.AAC.9